MKLSAVIPAKACVYVTIAVTLTATGAVSKNRLPPADVHEGRQAYSRLPMHFEPSQGQSGASLQWIARGAGYTALLRGSEMLVSPQRRGRRVFPEPPIRIGLSGGNPNIRGEGARRLPGVSNYVLGSNPSKWRTAVPHYATVTYRGVYPGIDVVYLERDGLLEYNFVVSPQADPERIRLHISGAERVRITDAGDLILTLRDGEFRQSRPIAYQELSEGRKSIPASYYLCADGTIGVSVGSAEAGFPVIIDPVLTYATFVGGSGNENFGNPRLSVDNNGNVYLADVTDSADFPVVNPVQGSFGGGVVDAFVTKLDKTGTTILYSTYLGGNGFEQNINLTVDPTTGEAYVSGYTDSNNFPGLASKTGLFVVRLSNSGALQISASVDFGLVLPSNFHSFAIRLSSTGFLYMTGTANFSDGRSGLFVSKLRLNANGVTILYSTTLTTTDGFGTGSTAIAVDAFDNVYVAGSTSSAHFPVTGSALQRTFGGGNSDLVVAKFDANGVNVYATYLGGSDEDFGPGISVDAAGNAYVTGVTYSLDFPVLNAFQSTNHSTAAFHQSAFVSKINSLGSQLMYSTYLGGSKNDFGKAIDVDSSGHAYVIGTANSSDFPTANAIQPVSSGAGDVFVVKLSDVGGQLLFSTYFGGFGNDLGTDIRVSVDGDVFLAGLTNSSVSFPRTQAIPRPYGGGFLDPFAAKLANANLRISEAVPLRSPRRAPAGSNVPITAQILNQSGSLAAENVVVKAGLPSTLTLISCTADGVSCAQPGSTVGGIIKPTLAANLPVTVSLMVHVNENVPDGALISFPLRVRSDTNDPEESDNTAIVSFAVGASHCTFALLRTSVSIGAAGDLGRADVLAPDGCTWNAASNVTWVTVSPASSSGNGVVRFSVGANAGSEPRFTDLTIAGQAFSIIQAASGCATAPSVSRTDVPQGGGSDTLMVNTGAGCSWTAAASPWITFPNGVTAVGNSSRPYITMPNTGVAPRTGVITVGSQSVHLAQGALNPSQAFTDVPPPNPFFNHIALMKLNNITSGCGAATYCPDDVTLRSQMAVFIVRLLMGGDNFSFSSTPFFTDVPTSHPHFKWVQKLKELGITSGCTATMYCPNDPVTRGQMAVFIIRAALGINATDAFPYPAVQRFTDVTAQHPYFSFIQKMGERGITTGCTATTYCPDAPTTRGQMAVFLIRALATQ